MADTQDDAADSRVSAVGRKRDLHELNPSQDKVEGASSADEDSFQRSSKRIKQIHEVPRLSESEDGILLNTAAPLPITSRADQVETSEPARHLTALPGSNLPVTWNSGIQCGLRTSFSNKRQSHPTSSTTSEEVGSSNDDHAVHNAPSKDGNARGSSVDAVGIDASSQGNTVDIGMLEKPLNQSQRKRRAKAKMALLPEARAALSPEELDDFNELVKTRRLKKQQKRHEANQSESESLDEIGDSSAVSDHVEDASVGEDGQIQDQLPPGFRILRKVQRDALSPGAQQSYDALVPLYKRKKKELKIKKKSQAQKLWQSSDDPTSFQTLSSRQVNKLDTQAKQDYILARNLHQAQTRRSELESLTLKVEEALAREKCWPLSDTRLMRKVASGHTYFPSKQRTKEYNNKSGTFLLSEVVDDERMPIRADNFSIGVFARSFLKENRGKWDVITQKVLVGSFSLYINDVYVKVLPLVPGLRTSADSLTSDIVSRAKLEITHMLTIHDNAHTSAFLGGSNLVSDEHTHEERTSKATSIEPMVVDGLASAVSSLSTSLAGHNAIDDSTALTPSTSIDHNKDQATAISHSNESDQDDQTIPTPTTQDIASHSSPPPMPRSDAGEVDSDHLSEAAPSSKTQGTNVRVEMADLNEMELSLQQKYFPSSGNTPRCLACAEAGHRILNCPALTCTACGDIGNHFKLTCPQNHRCGKCRERGHKTLDCPEKLARVGLEAVGCDLCGSKQHLEFACHFVWRSFMPKPEEIHTVRDIPVHCYTCGATGHYGPECGLHRGSLLTGGLTWTKENVRKYTNPTSQQRAVSAGIDYSIKSRPLKNFSIKGMANDPITFDDSDGEDFIRPKVNTSTERGQIHVGHALRPSSLLERHGQGHATDRRSILDPGNMQSMFDRIGRASDSARYGRERSFSPPPRYRDDDLRRESAENERRYIPHRDGNTYRPGDVHSPTMSSLPDRGRERRQNRGHTNRGRGGTTASTLPPRGDMPNRGNTTRRTRISKRDRQRNAQGKKA